MGWRFFDPAELAAFANGDSLAARRRERAELCFCNTKRHHVADHPVDGCLVAGCGCLK
jgi:hypothetical protein